MENCPWHRHYCNPTNVTHTAWEPHWKQTYADLKEERVEEKKRKMFIRSPSCKNCTLQELLKYLITLKMQAQHSKSQSKLSKWLQFTNSQKRCSILKFYHKSSIVQILHKYFIGKFSFQYFYSILHNISLVFKILCSRQ